MLRTLLWVLVINLGLACGAGLYESRITIPQWLVALEGGGYAWDRDAAVAANVGLRFWVFVTTIPLTLLALASLLGVRWVPNPVRPWWWLMVAAALADRAMTFGYFIPTMVRLMTPGALTDAETITTALQWVHLGGVRQAATLVAWVAALKALCHWNLQDGIRLGLTAGPQPSTTDQRSSST